MVVTWFIFDVPKVDLKKLRKRNSKVFTQDKPFWIQSWNVSLIRPSKRLHWILEKIVKGMQISEGARISFIHILERRTSVKHFSSYIRLNVNFTSNSEYKIHLLVLGHQKCKTGTCGVLIIRKTAVLRVYKVKTCESIEYKWKISYIFLNCGFSFQFLWIKDQLIIRLLQKMVDLFKL